MTSAAMPLSRDPMLPPRADGLGIGAILAVIVHLLLIAALAFGVSWRTHEPEGVVAELWSSTPQVAAPRATSLPAAPPATPPTPAPAVRPTPPARPAAEAPSRQADAQIAVEKARREDAKRQLEDKEALRRQQLQREAAEKEAAQKEAVQRQKAQRDKAAADARQEALRRDQLAQQSRASQEKELAEKARKEEAALTAQRDAYMKRMQGQAGATGDESSSGTAARSSGPSAGYAGRIKARIKPNLIFTDSIDGNPIATVEVRCATDGTIVSRKLIKSSGSSAWDDAVLRAIDKTESLPRDTDGRVPPVLQIEFKPRD